MRDKTILVVLGALLIGLLLINHDLEARVRKQNKIIARLVYYGNNRCLGYIEPEKEIKDIYVKKLTK